MISKKFIKSSFIYSFIGALPLASSVLLLPFYTNYLHIEDYGNLILLIGFTGLMQVIISFSFDAAVTNYYFDFKDNAEMSKQYMGTVITILLLWGTLVSLAMLALGPICFKWMFHGKIAFFPFGCMSVITAVCNGLYKTYTNLLITKQQPERYMWSNLFNFALTIAISLYGLYLFPYTLVGPMWGRLLSGILIAMISVGYFYQNYGFRLNFSVIAPTLKFNTPLFIQFILTWIMGNADRYIIIGYLSLREVGAYDFALKCTLLLDFVIMGLNSAISPKIFSIWKDKALGKSTPEVNRYYHGYTSIIWLMIGATLFLFPILLPHVVFKKEYLSGMQLLPLMCMAYSFKGLHTLYANPMLYQKKITLFPVFLGITNVIKIAAGIILIKHFGIYGAVYALLLPVPVEVFLFGWQANKLYSINFNSLKMLWLPMLLAGTIIITETAFAPTGIWIHLAYMLVIAASTYLVYRQEIKMSLSQLVFKRK